MWPIGCIALGSQRAGRAAKDGVSGVRKTERDKISTRRLSRTVLARFQCLRSLSFHLALAFTGQECDRTGADSEKSVSCTPNRAPNETLLYLDIIFVHL